MFSAEAWQVVGAVLLKMSWLLIPVVIIGLMADTKIGIKISEKIESLF